MPNQRQPDKFIIYAESPESRDLLRDRITQFGFSAVCFEKEAICFENLKPIAPKIIIVQTESREIVWRFIFAVYAIYPECPLLIVSDSLKAETYLNQGVQVALDFVPIRSKDDSLTRKVFEAIKRSPSDCSMARLPLFVGETEPIKKIRSMLPSIADSHDSVMITGEPGTGKELLVRLISAMARDESNLVKIDCGKLPSEMSIIGWLGAGAESKPATIFFNDIHLISKEVQPEILLVIDKAEHCSKTQKDFNGTRRLRVIAACEPVIEELLQSGHFRKDLFYRLNVIPIHMPSLKDRKKDIDLLMDYFVIEAGSNIRKSIVIPSQKARDALYLYQWPGNVEELKTFMVRIASSGNEACIFDNSNIPKVKKNTLEYFLKSDVTEDLPKPHEIKRSLADLHNMSLKKVCEEFVARTEKNLMKKALESTNWNRKKAAELLKISYKSMLNKMKAYDII